MLALTESRFIASQETALPHAAGHLTAVSPQNSDSLLIRSVVAGDKRALQVLYNRHNARVFRFALRVTRNTSSAEDVVSEVFLEVWRKAGGFKGKSQVSTWLLSIARNKALSTLRRRADRLDDDVANSIEDPTDGPEMTLLNKDRSAIIQQCLSQLSMAHREVVDLVYYHEKSVEEVAQITGLSPNTVKTRMFYARNRLETHLKAAGVDGS